MTIFAEVKDELRDLWWAPMMWPYFTFFVIFSRTYGWAWPLSALSFAVGVAAICILVPLMVPFQLVMFSAILAAAVAALPYYAIRALWQWSRT